MLSKSALSEILHRLIRYILDEVPDMLEAFGNDAKRFHLLPSTTEHGVSPHSAARSTFKQGEQTWVIREKKTKAKGNNRKRPSLIQRKNENWKKKRRNKCPELFGDLKSSTEVVCLLLEETIQIVANDGLTKRCSWRGLAHAADVDGSDNGF